jgi:hypothetical protein
MGKQSAATPRAQSRLKGLNVPLTLFDELSEPFDYRKVFTIPMPTMKELSEVRTEAAQFEK